MGHKPIQQAGVAVVVVKGLEGFGLQVRVTNAHSRWLSPYLPGTGFPSSQIHRNSHRDPGGRR